MDKISEVTQFLANQMAGIADGSVDPANAKIQATLSNSIVSTIKVQLEGHKLNGTKHRIKFLR